LPHSPQAPSRRLIENTTIVGVSRFCRGGFMTATRDTLLREAPWHQGSTVLDNAIAGLQAPSKMG
jgi:hypothetical protein